MPEEEKLEEIEKVKEDVEVGIEKPKQAIEYWKPKTELGRKVKNGEIKTIDEILSKGLKIMETEIVDILLPNLEVELLTVGQSKGKFGGGKGSIWRQTQKKTREGNKPSFGTLAAIGNRNGYVGIGYSKSRETVPARERAIRNAKLNIINIRRGCGGWACGCKEQHSIPFKVKGKVGSVEVTLLPAPRGTSLRTEEETQKILRLAGIKDIYSITKGTTHTKINLFNACFAALKNLTKIKI